MQHGAAGTTEGGSPIVGTAAARRASCGPPSNDLTVTDVGLGEGDELMSEATAERPRIYGTTKCSDTAAAREFLDARGFEYQYIDIDDDEDGRTMVRELNGGFESTPVITVPGGRWYAEPTAEDLEAIAAS